MKYNMNQYYYFIIVLNAPIFDIAIKMYDN